MPIPTVKRASNYTGLSRDNRITSLLVYRYVLIVIILSVLPCEYVLLLYLTEQTYVPRWVCSFGTETVHFGAFFDKMNQSISESNYYY